MSDSTPPLVTPLVTLEDLRSAALALRGVAVRTPLLPAPALGASVFLKPEMIQLGGSFKIRGAYAFLASLSPEARARGVVAPSSGNHAQAVALAAQLFGAPAVVVMPTNVRAEKRAGAERLGAGVELAGTTTKDRMDRARALSEAEGLTLVPPYDHARIIAGQGTLGLEIAEDLPEVRTVLVPVGGGGLLAGVATAVKLLVPSARVIGVEPEVAPKLTRARAAGRPVDIPAAPHGLADGLLAVRIGSIPFAHHEMYVDDVVTVPDAALARAMRFLLDRQKLLAEPSGAITVAALLEGLVRVDPPVVCVLSGGNVEFDGLRAHLSG